MLDANVPDGKVDMHVCDVGHTCGYDSTEKRDGLFIACRKRAPDASRFGPDLARVWLCDAAGFIVMFSSLIASVLDLF